MEQIKKNMAAKIAAFLLLQIMVMLTALSAAVVAINAGLGWYSYGEREFEQQLPYEVAYRAFNEIITSGYLYHDEEGTLQFEDENAANQRMTMENVELIEGENEAAGFGYQIPVTDGDEKVVKQLHADLKENPGASCHAFSDGGTEVEIYLVDWDREGALPPSLKAFAASASSAYRGRNVALGAGIAGLLGIAALLAFLVAAVGHGRKAQTSSLQKVPLDFLAVVACVPVIALAVLLIDTLECYVSCYAGAFIVLAALEVLGMSLAVTGFVLAFAYNAKQGAWWKNTVIYRLILGGTHVCAKLYQFMGWFFRQALRKIPLVWRTALVLAIVLLLNFNISYNLYWGGFAILAWFLEAIAVSVGAIYVALLLKRLKEGGKRLAEGNLSYQIDKKGMWFDFAEHADNLNSIGKGMSKAVEARMKSERFKAELIANVSHDIKTPLTSIINYVDFLKKEDLGSEKATEYIEVLDRQSRRLEKLTEDLVDASKAATGNIQMHMVPCQIGVLMAQTMGEYKEKAEKSDLKFIMKVPDEDLEIMADGKQLWRVFDNLLGNICKYSQPGTRVYLDLQEADGQAVILYRNTSKYELNMTEEELMERFVRGDSSRHTEGNGLGLSIARNLVELQGGSFRIVIDGDLFKVIIKFDLLY